LISGEKFLFLKSKKINSRRTELKEIATLIYFTVESLRDPEVFSCLGSLSPACAKIR
jgi:hypothetical protein